MVRHLKRKGYEKAHHSPKPSFAGVGQRRTVESSPLRPRNRQGNRSATMPISPETKIRRNKYHRQVAPSESEEGCAKMKLKVVPSKVPPPAAAPTMGTSPVSDLKGKGKVPVATPVR